MHGLNLQISLSIKTLSFNIKHSFWIWTLNSNKITWNHLSIIDSYYLTNSNLSPHFLYKFFCWIIIYFDLSLIFLLIFNVSLSIFISIFTHRNDHNNRKRKSHGWCTIWDRNWFDSLHVSNDQEITVCKFLELIEQVLWNKVPNGVFGSSNIVVRESSIFILMFWFTLF